MRIAVTGATGFLGRYIIRDLLGRGESLRCWYRTDRSRARCQQAGDSIEWVSGQLGEKPAAQQLLDGCDALVHAALWRPGTSFQGQEGDLLDFAARNVMGSLQLFEAARQAGVGRVVFISSCAVHDRILSDRRLDETHPLWPASHYGAHKAALEAFVHSYGLGHDFSICALRPTGIYGIADPPEQSKWFVLVKAVLDGAQVSCHRGGKEVHAADVARATALLLRAENVQGEAFNCYDRYISEWDVANLAKEISGADCQIDGEQKQPKNQIETSKLRGLGMQFGGTELLRETIAEMVQLVRAT
jgi:nucleoside-diphosphate-sugar epimerase